MSGITYLASPYTDSRLEIMQARFEDVVYCAGWLMNKGEIVYSPIAHTHPIAVSFGLPRDWNYWERVQSVFLKMCERFQILRLDGWDRSKGIKGERDIAKEYMLPISFIDPVYGNGRILDFQESGV